MLHQPLKCFRAFKLSFEHWASGAANINCAPALVFAVTGCGDSSERLLNALATVKFSLQ